MDEKQGAVLQNVKKLKMLEDFYCEMATILNEDVQQTVYTSPGCA